MPKTLLTGGSGFIASHVLEYLLGKGHTVVTTVRSTDKANKIKANNPNAGDKLQFAIVEDIAKPDAFDKAIISDPPFDYVIHTASPFHFNVNDTKSDLLDPAIIGTTGILKAIKKSAPSVKRVVITSSFAAITDPVRKPVDHTYSEQDWNGITEEEALKDASSGYRASKTFAERAAWDFVEKEKPNFDLVTMNPPLVFGPIHANLQTLDGLNTSNQRVRNCITGAFNGKVAPTGVHLWVDVRDLAKAHVDALQTEGAGGKRFFVVAGHFSNNQIVEIVRKTLPQYADKLPTDLSEGGFPADGKMAGYDNSRVDKVLGIKYHTFDETIADTAKSLVPLL